MLVTDICTLVAIPPDAWRDRVSARTGRPCVSRFEMEEIGGSICSACVSVATSQIVSPISDGKGKVLRQIVSPISDGKGKVLCQIVSPISDGKGKVLCQIVSPISDGKGKVLRQIVSPISDGKGKVLRQWWSLLSVWGSCQRQSKLNNTGGHCLETHTKGRHSSSLTFL